MRAARLACVLLAAFFLACAVVAFDGSEWLAFGGHFLAFSLFAAIAFAGDNNSNNVGRHGRR